MRWEGCEWTGCSTGGGEETKGYEDGGPPTLCQPANQQGGGEEVNNLWSQEGVGGLLGSMAKFLGFSFIFIQEVCFQSLERQGLAGLPVPVFGRIEREEIFG